MAFYRRRPRPDAEKCADPAKARASALETLAGQEVSANMLYERLCRRYTEQAAAAAVAEMVQLDYVNDARYAEARAHSLLAGRRRVGGQPLPQKTGHRPPRPCGGCPAAPRLCLPRHQRSHPQGGGGMTPSASLRSAAPPRGRLTAMPQTFPLPRKAVPLGKVARRKP